MTRVCDTCRKTAISIMSGSFGVEMIPSKTMSVALADVWSARDRTMTTQHGARNVRVAKRAAAASKVPKRARSLRGQYHDCPL